MKTMWFVVLSVVMLGFLAVLAPAFFEEPTNQQQREAMQQQYNNGNYNDAYEGYRKLALDSEDDPLQVGSDLTMATSALQNLGRSDEIDAFREEVINAHAGNWRLLQAAAENYLNV